MSQIALNTNRYATAVASLSVIKEGSVLSLTEDDLEFLTSKKLWIGRDRSRARKCLEAATYATLDYIGLPRIAAPAEFIAATIAYFVSPVNFQVASIYMSGTEFSEHIINGVDAPVSADVLFAAVLQITAGIDTPMEDRFTELKQKCALALV